jgi:hypothetical protein
MTITKCCWSTNCLLLVLQHAERLGKETSTWSTAGDGGAESPSPPFVPGFVLYGVSAGAVIAVDGDP